MTIWGNRPPKFVDDADTFDDMCDFLVAYSEYEQQMHITSQDRVDRVVARGQELVDSSTQTMVGDGL